MRANKAMKFGLALMLGILLCFFGCNEKGDKGDPGDPGIPGKDGFSPWVKGANGVYTEEKIGIGLTSPEADFHVNGSAIVEDDLQIGGNLYLNQLPFKTITYTSTGELPNETSGGVSSSCLEVYEQIIGCNCYVDHDEYSYRDVYQNGNRITPDTKTCSCYFTNVGEGETHTHTIYAFALCAYPVIIE